MPITNPADLITRSYFRTRFSPNAVRTRVWQDIASYLTPIWQIKPSARVLEIGTGYGSWIRSIPAQHRVGLDLNPDLVSLFREQGIADVEPIVGNCTDLSRFENGSFDLVCASNVLEHLTLDDALRCAAEVYRVLKPGGRICLVQPNFALKPREYFDDFTHRTIFTHESLKDLLESMGFETLRVWKRFMPFSMKSSTARLSFLVPLYLRSPIKPFAGQMCVLSQKPHGSRKPLE